MRSLEWTRQPLALSARPTAAVPANASCAMPGEMPSFLSLPVRNSSSFVLLPMYRIAGRRGWLECRDERDWRTRSDRLSRACRREVLKRRPAVRAHECAVLIEQGRRKPHGTAFTRGDARQWRRVHLGDGILDGPHDARWHTRGRQHVEPLDCRSLS